MVLNSFNLILNFMLWLLLVEITMTLAKERLCDRDYHEPNLRPKRDHPEKEDNGSCEASTNFPKVELRSDRISNAHEICAPIR